MKVIAQNAWQFAGFITNFFLAFAAFLLWSVIAAAAGWVLWHLPALWQLHLEDETGVNYTITAIVSYAVLAGVLFLAFAGGALQMLGDAIDEVRRFARLRRQARDIAAYRRARHCAV
jgi:hypothetical protein